MMTHVAYLSSTRYTIGNGNQGRPATIKIANNYPTYTNCDRAPPPDFTEWNERQVQRQRMVELLANYQHLAKLTVRPAHRTRRFDRRIPCWSSRRWKSLT